MSTPESLQKRPISIWKRLLGAVGLVVLVTLIVNFAVSRYQENKTRRALEERMARLDETDPGWRFADLEASRPNPPPERNNAVMMLEAMRRIPSPTTAEDLGKKIGTVALPHLLDETRRKTLEKELPAFEPAMAVLRRIADIPEGRHKLTPAPIPTATRLDDQWLTRFAVRLLSLDALHLSMQQKAGPAMRSSRAALHVTQSLADEPVLVSQLLRVYTMDESLNMIERALALGEPPAAELAAAAKALAREETFPTYRVAIRGERATYHGLFEGLASGAIPKADLRRLEGASDIGSDWRLRLSSYSRASIQKDHELLLQMFSEVVTISNLPMHEQLHAEKALLAKIIIRFPPDSMVRRLVPAPDRLGGFIRRKAAHVRCMQVLIALERHRLATGGWPARLEDLPRELLPAVPLDPFDGKPLRYLRRPDGVSVFSSGYEGIADGGATDPVHKTESGDDFVFRLWDVKARRQPPLPPPPPAEEGTP